MDPWSFSNLGLGTTELTFPTVTQTPCVRGVGALSEGEFTIGICAPRCQPRAEQEASLLTARREMQGSRSWTKWLALET